MPSSSLRLATTPTQANPEGRLAFPIDGEDEWDLPTGQIHLHGDQIVSHRHKALDRFQEWQRINHARIGKMDTRQRWDVYISDPMVNVLATPSASPPESPPKEEPSGSTTLGNSKRASG
ncbi:hypothetical protein FRB95_005029 [Tulasnella sp. JGI-2019a]|nr:hypothetical protein FRB95_005029 [Tulasnella sp. JGI-2019a]